MYDFEAATGITQENVEQIVRDRERAVCDCCGADMSGATVGLSHICEGCSLDELCEEPA